MEEAPEGAATPIRGRYKKQYINYKAGRRENQVKGIVLTDFPENFQKCEFYGFRCKLTGQKCNRKSGRPDECPIIPLPEAKKPKNLDELIEIDKLFGERVAIEELAKSFKAIGFNDCLRQIEKGGQ